MFNIWTLVGEPQVLKVLVLYLKKLEKIPIVAIMWANRLMSKHGMELLFF